MKREKKEDIIIKNGRIYNVDNERKWEKEVEIRGGRIMEVGRKEEIEEYRKGEKEVVEIGGRMEMKGLVDVKNKIMMGGKEDIFEKKLKEGERVDDI